MKAADGAGESEAASVSVESDEYCQTRLSRVVEVATITVSNTAGYYHTEQFSDIAGRFVESQI